MLCSVKTATCTVGCMLSTYSAAHGDRLVLARDMCECAGMLPTLQCIAIHCMVLVVCLADIVIDSRACNVTSSNSSNVCL